MASIHKGVGMYTALLTVNLSAPSKNDAILLYLFSLSKSAAPFDGLCLRVAICVNQGVSGAAEELSASFWANLALGLR